MTTLISPANKRPCEFVEVRDGFICLRMDYVTPQVRWFTLAAVERVNPMHTCAEPPPPLTVTLTPEMAASVNASANVRIVVRERISLWHEWMEAA